MGFISPTNWWHVLLVVGQRERVAPSRPTKNNKASPRHDLRENWDLDKHQVARLHNVHKVWVNSILSDQRLVLTAMTH